MSAEGVKILSVSFELNGKTYTSTRAEGVKVLNLSFGLDGQTYSSEVTMEVKPVDSKSKLTPEQISARQEGWKLVFDLFKHIATVSAGAILLIATFYDRIVRDRANI